MKERHAASRSRRRLVSPVRRLLAPGRKLSVQEQVQAAANRYEADVRAAGVRYDAAMTRILAGLSARSGELPDPEPTAAEHVN